MKRGRERQKRETVWEGEKGRGRDCSMEDNWKAGMLRLPFTWCWNKLFPTAIYPVT